MVAGLEALPWALLLALLGSAACAQGPSVAQCGAVSSIFDLPDIHGCHAALRELWARQPCPPPPGASPCCQPATEFVSARCHCWRAFDAATLAKVQGIAAACPQPQSQAELPAAGREGAAAGAAGGHASAAAAAGTDGSKNKGGKASGGHDAAMKIFTGVLSSSKYRERRDAIRATWATDPLLYRVRFFLARSPNATLFDEVRREAVEQGDLVVLPLVEESYFNITHQTLEVLRFGVADPQVTHVLKVDDDSYVRPQQLLARLQHLPRQRLFLGYIESPGGGPHRDKGNQWYVSKEEWESERYPPWAHGAGYVLSADLAGEIAAGAAAKPLGGRLFKLEDISVGSWVEWVEQEGGEKVSRVKDTRFNFNGCNSRDLVSHYITPAMQRCMWANAGRCVCNADGTQKVLEHGTAQPLRGARVRNPRARPKLQQQQQEQLPSAQGQADVQQQQQQGKQQGKQEPGQQQRRLLAGGGDLRPEGGGTREQE